MISGRGFIGIAAQSLGMGRPVLPPIWVLIFGVASAVGCGAGLRKAPAAGCHAALRHHQIVGLMPVPSRVMRKLVCRLWLNEVSRQ